MFSVIGFILILLSGISQAATYYVSNSGSATWTNCTNISTPCSVQTAFSNAVAGDVVNFRGGTYIVPQLNTGGGVHGYYEPANSGTSNNPITFQAYPGETPIFNGTHGAGSGGDPLEVATIFGTWGKSYLVFDGFKLQSDDGTTAARFLVHGNDSGTPINSSYVTLKNLDINGGSTVWTTTDNREGIRVDIADHTTIQKCKIYNFRQNADWHNTSAFKSYNAWYTIIEYNDIYNVSNGLYNKRDGLYDVFRYNYIHNVYHGIYTAAYVGTSSWNQRNTETYHNVIDYNHGIDVYGIGIYYEVDSAVDANNTLIYNNTIYTSVTNNGVPIYIGQGTGQIIHSNIIQVGISASSYGLIALAPTSTASEIDYNQYGSLSTFKSRFNGTYYNTLNNWQASGIMIGGLNPDTHSLSTNPLFQNASGTLSQLNDFKLAKNSPCKGAGKGGVDMGADILKITGAPSPPMNLRLQ